MPRFSLQHLMASLTLVTIGVAGVAWVLSSHGDSKRAAVSTLGAVWVFAGVCIGVGIAILFDRPILVLAGATLGFVIQVLLLFALAIAMQAAF